MSLGAVSADAVIVEAARIFSFPVCIRNSNDEVGDGVGMVWISPLFDLCIAVM